MKAMIFAAGLGTRLRPLTETIPKALVEVNGVPLLEIVIRRLQKYGVDGIIINVHHLAEHILDFLKQHKYFGIEIHISDETEQLLDTGGGLKKAAWFFNDHLPFLVHNVDILSDINLQALYQFHFRHPQALVTLAVTHRNSTRCLLFDQKGVLCGWENRETHEVKMARPTSSSTYPLAFSGIHVISPTIFSLMPKEKVFSIIDIYLRAAATETILAFQHDHTLWLDVGKRNNLSQASEILGQIYTHDSVSK